MAAHQTRKDAWDAKKDKWERPAGGGLLPPVQKGAPPPRRRKKATTQKQIRHDWAYIVGWYQEIRSHTPSGLGLQRILFTEVRAYQELFGIDMEGWEVDTLLKLDVVWFECLPKKAEA